MTLSRALILTTTLGMGLAACSKCKCGDTGSDESTTVMCIEDNLDGATAGDDGNTLADAAASCAQVSGSACDAEQMMTREAANCIAEVEVGLAAGLTDWAIRTTYNEAFETVVWTVTSTTFQEGETTGGDGVTLHATDGDILETWGWEEGP